MLHYEYFTFPMPFRDQLYRFHCPLSAAHRVSDSQISGANPSSLSLKASWMDVYSEIYDWWLQTAMTEASNHSTWLTDVPKMFSYICFLIPDYSRQAANCLRLIHAVCYFLKDISIACTTATQISTVLTFYFLYEICVAQSTLPLLGCDIM